MREGLISASFWWEGLVSAGFGSFQVVSAGFGSFRFLVITKLKLLLEGSQTNTSASFSSLTTCRPTSVSYLSFLALPIADHTQCIVVTLPSK